MFQPPLVVALEDWLDEPVVGQLEPGQPPPLLLAHEVEVDQLPDHVVTEAVGFGLPFEHLVAEVLGRDQLVLDPLTDVSVANTARLTHLEDDLVVEPGERVVDVCQLGDIGLGNFRRTRVAFPPERPEPLADDLELHRLDVRAGLFGELAVGLADPDQREVLDELVGRGGKEVGRRGCGGGGPAHGRHGRVIAQRVEMESCARRVGTGPTNGSIAPT